ncbi:amidohydrolase [Novosphingobium flavum]|uniref:Amidohydrolase n=1 Tax=Novosphingobium flavum TaxID=1778672 RepID=A0A7X1FSJ6_9SPHN|nr:amidohydrolase [Novosphingobium flavum]
MIYFNGKVLTVDRVFSTAGAFAVRGDRFVAVGSDAQVRRLAARSTRLVDLKGATVVPGFADSHDHLWNSARFEFHGVNLIGVRSVAVMQDRLRAALAKEPPGRALFTSLGWSISPAPTRQDLDAVSATTPIILLSSRHASGVVNTAALRQLGITRSNPSYKGGKVPVDGTGEPTGVLPGYPLSLTMVHDLLPPPTPAEQDDFLGKGMAQRNALGITSTHELALWPDGRAGLERMRREGKLTLRMALGLEFPDEDRTDEAVAALPRPDRRDPWLFIDSIGEEPWVPGMATLPDYTALLRKERQLGWRPAPHVSADKARGATYDEALDQTLAAFEAVDRTAPLRAQRWYVEHAPFATPAEIARLSRLGAIVSVQDSGYEPMAPPPLPPERMARQNPLRSLLDQGIVVIGGSDYRTATAEEPAPNNPMNLIYFYTTRRNKAGGLTAPAERISRAEALRILTANPAYATFEEGRKGRIAPGLLADFVILDHDLMTVPDEALLKIRPLATFVGGRRVYAAPGGRF